MKETYKLFNTPSGQILFTKVYADDEDAPYGIKAETIVEKDDFNVTPSTTFQYMTAEERDEVWDNKIDQVAADGLCENLADIFGEIAEED